MTQIIRFYAPPNSDKELCAQFDAWYDTMPFPNVIGIQLLEMPTKRCLVVIYRRPALADQE